MLRFELNRLGVWVSDPKERALFYGQIAIAAPRLLVHLTSLAALAAVTSSCVPVTRYEEAESASQVELAARRRAEATIVDLQQKLDVAQAELAARERKLADSERAVNESKLQSSLVQKERDEQNTMVDQLRNELARAGDHLRFYSDQKRELEQALGSKDKDAVALLSRLMRDLTLQLGQDVQQGKMLLDAKDGMISLALSGSGATLIAVDSEKAGTKQDLSNGLDTVLTAVAKVLQDHPSAKLEIRGGDGKEDGNADAVKAALVERGVAEERIQKAAKPSPEQPEQPAPADGLTADVSRPDVQPLELCFTSN